jgi:hypothetical protein
MLDPNVPLATYVGKPKVRVVTPDGKKVIAWGNVLPTTQDGAKRQEAAVCAAFTKLKLEIKDFMTVQEFNHVMGGNGPPRYNFHTGYYYDYGQYPDGHPTGQLICTDDNLLVAKSIRPPRPGKRPGKDVGGTEADEDDFEYGTDDKAAQAAVKAEKK